MLIPFLKDAKLYRLLAKNIDLWRAKLRPNKSFQTMPRSFQVILLQKKTCNNTNHWNSSQTELISR